MTARCGNPSGLALVVLVLSLAGPLVGPTSATSPPGPCLWDDNALVTVPVVDGVYPPFAIELFPEDVGNGFVLTEVYGAEERNYGVEWFILQHCPTGDELAVRLPPGDTHPAEIEFERILFGAERFTLRQVGERMATLFGAGARITQGQYGSCACDWLEANG